MKKTANSNIRNIEQKIINHESKQNCDPRVREQLLSELKENQYIFNQNLFLISHQQQIEKDEQPTAYFHNKIQNQKQKQEITSLKYKDRSTGIEVTTTDQKQIQEQTFLFYQALYSEEPVDIDNQNWLLSHMTNKRITQK